jgi:V/A-type H+/Na+-transporting ATPase subunit C
LILSLFSYAAAQGFMRARLSRLLDGLTWTRLLQAGSFPELGQLLSQTGLASDGHLLLQNLRGEIAAAGCRLVRFLPPRAAGVLAWYNRRFEIENLKAVLRAVHYQLEPRRAAAALIPLPSDRWRFGALIEAESIPTVIEGIRDSPFARPLEHAMERYQQERRLFYLEVALDLFYFQRLVRLIERQGGREAADARRFLGRWIAIQNLTWAYRYRIYGGMTPEEIVNYTLHHAFAAGLDAVRRVALGSPLPMEAGRLGFHISPEVSELEGLTEVEFLAEQERFRSATVVIGRPLFGLRGVFAYLWLLEAQVRDLIVIVEGKRAGLASAEIRRRMVRAA